MGNDKGEFTDKINKCKWYFSVFWRMVDQSQDYLSLKPSACLGEYT